MSSVGYGYDIPSDDNSRMFTIFVMIFGIFGVYGAINSVVATRLAALNKAQHKKQAHLDSAQIYKRHHRRLIINFFGILASLFGAAGLFALVEDWTFVRGLYFAVQTATTVGFGDIPINKAVTTKLIGAYIILSTILLTFAFNNFQTLNQDFERLKEAAEFAKRKKSLAKIKELDTGHGVPLDTFLLAVMEQLGVLDRERDLGPWIKKFKEIDADGSGFIDAAEIEAFSDEQKTLASAQLNQLKNSDTGTMGMFPLAGRVTNSFSMIFGMKIHDLENMEHSEHSESDEDDDSSSEDSFSSLGSDQDRGEVMFAGGLRYLLFGTQNSNRRLDSAHLPHVHHLHHRHTGDMAPGDHSKSESMTLSMDDDDIRGLDGDDYV
eukprot:CAMPEP_0184982700 /NCGR_PEP_ID=MMETSP1098-20130426/12127_1 /TAXON_ID=89044 /ORGANISM="Spumella elongata, Strain CCAP 955/1" /LENGTH=377 /DNA_ID=CAMNT_0027506441 /DNA_START=250 /DNA_END=1383 /DNA_ORIENTATION=+